ncbi:MAG: hypothetical protein AMJ90_09295 [candidate division Zixibacteria bacterium SM23_73_2]|nr:MAG: hypothetical protein AMJ90_09295 [candidate division Zixibacteria bacterium SM23_73_2]
MKIVITAVLMLTIFATAYGAGLSEYESDLIYRVKKLFKEDVSAKKITTEPLPKPVCATPLMGELKFRYESLSPEAKGILKPYLQRPSLSTSYDSPGGYFKIHYDTTGSDSVYQAHADTNSNGVPDYVDRCAVIFDSVKAFEISTLGYATPPSDGGYGGGGDGRYDVYLIYLNPGVLGYTQAENYYPYPKATSYIVMRNDYLGYGYPDQLDLLRVTAAHEFFHAIQLGYDATEWTVHGQFNPYWLEISSVWMEDIAYDNVNDYLNYLEYFYRYPQLSLETFANYQGAPVESSLHCYASCIWGIYLTEKHGINVMKDIWGACSLETESNVIPAIDSILGLLGSSYEEAFREFTVWNFFTYNRADTANFYSEGNLFDPNSRIFPTISQDHYFASFDSFYNASVLYPPDHLGSNYIFFHPKTSSGGARLYFYGDSTASWKVSVIGYKSEASAYTSEMTLDTLQNGNIEVMNAYLYNDLIMVASVTDTTGGPWNFAYAGAWDPTLDVEEEKEIQIPGSFYLSQNYPNPFNATTTIPFTVHGKQEKENDPFHTTQKSVYGSQFMVHSPIHTTLTIYNVLGQKIKTLVDENKYPGNHKAIWDGKDDSGKEVSSGIYFYKLKSGDFEQVKKLLYLK